MVEIVEQGYSNRDKETALAYDYDTKSWYCHVSTTSHITKLMKLYPDCVTVLEQLSSGKPVLIKAKLPKEAISFRGPTKRKPLTDEQKAQARERLKKAREKKLESK